MVGAAPDARSEECVFAASARSMREEEVNTTHVVAHSALLRCGLRIWREKKRKETRDGETKLEYFQQQQCLCPTPCLFLLAIFGLWSFVCGLREVPLLSPALEEASTDQLRVLQVKLPG